MMSALVSRSYPILLPRSLATTFAPCWTLFSSDFSTSSESIQSESDSSSSSSQIPSTLSFLTLSRHLRFSQWSTKLQQPQPTPQSVVKTAAKNKQKFIGKLKVQKKAATLQEELLLQKGHTSKRHRLGIIEELRNKVATSEWILVSNVPQTSKLSDILPSLDQILKLELEKGIIDWDQLFLTLEDDSPTSSIREIEEALQERKALMHGYSTQKIDAHCGIPLWNPSIDSNVDLLRVMLLEARVYLSQSARLNGWFLRFPNRSVAHAILCHVWEAEQREREILKEFQNKQSLHQRDIELWTKGLAREVRKECERNSMSTTIEWNQSDKEECNNDLEQDQTVVHESLQDKEQNVEAKGDVTRFIKKYMISNPYPTNTAVSPSVKSAGGYHRLICGSTPLQIQEFRPNYHSFGDQQCMWEDFSFHIGPILNLSDTVVRVETNGLNTTVGDILYLFRAYDMEMIWPETVKMNSSYPLSQLTDPPQCDAYLKSIGWNLSMDRSQVECLIQRSSKKAESVHGSSRSSPGSMPGYTTFLLRFATPFDAQMAIRDKQGWVFKNEKFTVSQYPMQILCV